MDEQLVVEIMTELGAPPQAMRAVQCAPSFEEGKRRLEELKGLVRKTYKRLAFELHPDRNNGDAVKAEKLKVVSRLKDEFMKLELRPPRPPPQRIQYVWSNSTSTTTSTGFWDGGQVTVFF